MMAWRQLGMEHVTYNSGPSSQSFFLMTWMHAVHLGVGVAALFAALLGLRFSKQLENRQIFVDLSTWYWHTMGGLWLLLFVLLVKFQ
jgi:cytochrome c oxidase subunit 3